MRMVILLITVILTVATTFAVGDFTTDAIIQRLIHELTKSGISPDAVPLRGTFSALNGLMSYFWSHIYELNLDAVFVTGVARDQLSVILNKLDKFPETSFAAVPYDEVKSQLKSIIQTANLVTSWGLPLVQIKQGWYFDKVKQLCTAEFWNLDKPSRVTDPSLVAHTTDNVQLNRFGKEEALTSDDCLSEATRIGYAGQGCNISDYCWKAMTDSTASGYMLIHQVLYLQVLEKIKCDAIATYFVNKYGQVSVNNLFNVFCSNALEDVKLTDTIVSIDTYKQDIFMEDAFICGMAGFRDFFRHPWLTKILSWQLPQGCYGVWNAGETLKLANMGITVNKREEKLLPDNCLTHKSAVATGVLAQYVRYLLEDPLLKFD